ncbi:MULTISPECIES: tRNA lysidine(34) synthetase TilS [Ramlibacter]|uniref:tRNA(Ile)-lysidine synthase n=1 Tax=Ramlibacter aquaticus TaxID=2780094 RepID=A0ABR9SCJ8_9BURK|nr:MULTISPECIES: tRNA lysidine(34) synthetase TilS [Ramlibacter]MBE7940078.1 tRNA lysidine(34) synthetase TilS [Ramlibacter aquaticus]
MSLTLDQALERFQPALPLAVALSGGADSCALLVACARRWPGQVRALHVHHGLQPAADGFQAHCEALCRSLDLPLHTLHVDARHAAGESPEDAARRARYAALAAAAHEAGCAMVALAQHADDQAETLLLALSRGAGLAGLAGMRPDWTAGGMRFARPLLDVPGAALREFLRSQAIAWVEDPSNQDVRFTRNRIRARLTPALDQAFPGFRDTFARSARHAAQAQALLEEFGALDLAAAGAPPRLQALRALGRARQANLLRHWLRSVHGTQASEAQMEELLDQVQACTTRGHAIRLKVGLGFVTRDGERLAYTASV